MKKNIAKLVAALRSGSYRQGKGTMHSTDGCFCVHGVACDVFRKETGKGEWVPSPYTNGKLWFELFGDVCNVSMPLPVAQWFGWDTIDPRIGGRALMVLNDLDDRTFSEIADFIEAAHA